MAEIEEAVQPTATAEPAAENEELAQPTGEGDATAEPVAEGGPAEAEAPPPAIEEENLDYEGEGFEGELEEEDDEAWEPPRKKGIDAFLIEGEEGGEEAEEDIVCCDDVEGVDELEGVVELEEEPVKDEEKEEESKIRDEDIEYMELARDIVEKNKDCEELRGYIEDRRRKLYRTKCEDREIAALQKIYDKEHEELQGLIRDAMDFNDLCEDGDQGRDEKRRTTIDEDLAAARMLKEMCAPCATCSDAPKPKKKLKIKTCKNCGAKTAKLPTNPSRQLEQAVTKIDNTLQCLRTLFDDLKKKEVRD